MTEADCPTREQLRHFSSGNLSESEYARIEDHLGACRECESTLDQLERSDALIHLLRRPSEPAVDEWLNEKEFHETIAVIRSRLGKGATTEGRRMDSADDRASLFEIPHALPVNLGQYRLIALAGRGGMGLVYKAVHEQLGRVVAIKTLPRDKVHRPEVHERFLREIRAIGKLQHPNIVNALDADEIQGLHFLAMDYVEGFNLSTLIQMFPGTVSVPAVCEIIRQAASGLKHVHDHGIVHRDIKPANLMLSSDGVIRILDLGLALLMPQHSVSGHDLTTADQLIGTIDYMAPEQADDPRTVDHRVDIYGLGATLYALLAGRPPLADQPRTLLQKLSRLASQVPDSICRFRSDVPAPLAALVEQMLAKDRTLRPQGAEEVIQRLAPYCDSTELLTLARTAQQNLTEKDTQPVVGASDLTVILNDLKPMPKVTGRIESATKITGRRKLRVPLAAFLAALTGLVTWGIFHTLKESRDDNSGRSLSRSDVTFAGHQPADSEVIPTNGTGTGSTQSASDMAKMYRLNPASADSTALLEALVESEQSSVASGNSSESDAWNVFSTKAPTDIRFDAIHRARDIVPLETLLKRLRGETETSIRFSLLQTLTNWKPEEVINAAAALSPEPWPIIDAVVEMYVNDPSPAIHAMADFLLRSWDQHRILKELQCVVQQRLVSSRSGWFQPMHVGAMIVFSGPRTENLGSPALEVGRFTALGQNEDSKTVHIPYSFAVCATEVTRRQCWRLGERYWEVSPPEQPDLPENHITWQQAARYCNRLSELEGITPDQFCYEVVNAAQGAILREKSNSLELTGYRLPTDDEWEIACRAGVREARPFGDVEDLFPSFVASSSTSVVAPIPVASRMPNDAGLFDMLGNVSEWTHSADASTPDGDNVRRVRGGSVWTRREGLRSAARYYYHETVASYKTGFRVARTLPSNPRTDVTTNQLPIDVYVGPPACPAGLERFLNTSGYNGFALLTENHPISLGNWQFGPIPSRRIRLKNRGTVAVRMSQLPWMTDIFEFDPPPELDIPPGGTTEFGVRMRQVSAGERHHVITVKCNAPTEQSLPPIFVTGCLEGKLMMIEGVGVAGTAPSEVHLGTVPRGALIGRRFYAMAIGNESVVSNAKLVDGPFAITDNFRNPLLPTRLTESFRLALRTEALGQAEGVVTIQTGMESVPEFTYHVQATVSESRPFSLLGLYRRGTWLIDHNRDAVPDEIIELGTENDHPLTGDWNGDGIGDIAIWSTGENSKTTIRYHLRGENPLPISESEVSIDTGQNRLIAADRDGDLRSEIGYCCPNPKLGLLVFKFDTTHDHTFQDEVVFGQSADDIVTGDWDGDHREEPGVSAPGGLGNAVSRRWLFPWNGETQPRSIVFASRYDFPVAGDWDGDGDDDPGSWRPVQQSNSSFWMFDVNGDGTTDHDLENFGQPGDIPVVIHDRRLKRRSQ